MIDNPIAPMLDTANVTKLDTPSYVCGLLDAVLSVDGSSVCTLFPVWSAGVVWLSVCWLSVDGVAAANVAT